jgi:hypothetical protein
MRHPVLSRSVYAIVHALRPSRRFHRSLREPPRYSDEGPLNVYRTEASGVCGPALLRKLVDREI